MVIDFLDILHVMDISLRRDNGPFCSMWHSKFEVQPSSVLRNILIAPAFCPDR